MTNFSPVRKPPSRWLLSKDVSQCHWGHWSGQWTADITKILASHLLSLSLKYTWWESWQKYAKLFNSLPSSFDPHISSRNSHTRTTYKDMYFGVFMMHVSPASVEFVTHFRASKLTVAFHALFRFHIRQSSEQVAPRNNWNFRLSTLIIRSNYVPRKVYFGELSRELLPRPFKPLGWLFDRDDRTRLFCSSPGTLRLDVEYDVFIRRT